MEKKLPHGYRCFFVPLCKTTSQNQPQKVFLQVPKDKKLKKKWFERSNRQYYVRNSHFFCCEDHFDVSLYIFQMALRRKYI